MKNSISRFEWLQEYRQLDHDLKYLKWNLRKTKAELERWVGGDLSNVSIGKNSNAAHIEENIERIENEINWREETMKELLILIDSFDGIENKILVKKYIEGETLEEIAFDTDMPYALSYIQKKHAELKRRIEWLDDWDETKYKTQVLGSEQLR